MPDMNGLELSNNIEKIDNKIKVCFISAYDGEDKALREQFPSLKIKCFLPKPIAVSDLLRKVETELLGNSLLLLLKYADVILCTPNYSNVLGFVSLSYFQ
jgi:two-component SAPR family response regulator